MKFFKKLKSSNFWVSMISAVILIMQAVFNVDIKTEYLNQIILGILGILVMTGIVTDTPNNEVTVKQDFDFEKITDTLTSVFTQIGNTLQTDINKIVSQSNNATQNISTKPMEENEVQPNVNLVVDSKVDELANQQSSEVNIGVENIVEVKQEEVIIPSVPTQHEVVIPTQIQQTNIVNNAPKNEL